MNNSLTFDDLTAHAEHHGVKGMRWGVRRYQNTNGTLTLAGQRRYRKLHKGIQKAEVSGDHQKAKELSEQMKSYNKELNDDKATRGQTATKLRNSKDTKEFMKQFLTPEQIKENKKEYIERFAIIAGTALAIGAAVAIPTVDAKWTATTRLVERLTAENAIARQSKGPLRELSNSFKNTVTEHVKSGAFAMEKGKLVGEHYRNRPLLDGVKTRALTSDTGWYVKQAVRSEQAYNQNLNKIRYTDYGIRKAKEKIRTYASLEPKLEKVRNGAAIATAGTAAASAVRKTRKRKTPD